jgi:SAM-dependent methyltransferase
MGADTWSSGAAYEPYVGRWSRLVADTFLAWLAQPAGKQWLDVGCGTGALTVTILQVAAPSAVVSIDPSEGYVAFSRGHLPDPRVRFSVGDAQALPEPSGTFDAVVSGLVLNFVPHPAQAVREMARVARAGAVVAAYVWDYADQMQLMRYFWDAAVALDPAARPFDEGVRFPLCRPEPLAALWRIGGLRDVEVRAIDVPTVFHDFDDYWSPFLGGQGPAPGYAMSRDETRREQLRERIRSHLPISADGSIALSARAWAVRGQP